LKLIEVRQTFVERKDQLKPLVFCRWLGRRAKVMSEAWEERRAEHDPAGVQVRIMTNNWNWAPVGGVLGRQRMFDSQSWRRLSWVKIKRELVERIEGVTGIWFELEIEGHAIRRAAASIPGAKLTILQGMGHAIPMPIWPKIIDAIDKHAHGASAKAAWVVQPATFSRSRE
jgi:hypothetical protein